MPDDGLKETGGMETPIIRCQKLLKDLDLALTQRVSSPNDPELIARCQSAQVAVADGLNGTSPPYVRAAFWPYMIKEGPVWEDLEAQIVGKPFCRPPDVEFSREQGFEYWGNHLNITNLPESDNFTAVEVSGGVIGILDQNGKAVGVIDFSPRVARESREATVELLPLEKLFETSLATKVQASLPEIADFLENYSTFFAQTGDFARITGLSHSINLNVVPMEGKFLVYRQLKGEFLKPQVKEIIDRNFPDGEPLGQELLQRIRGCPETFDLRTFQGFAFEGWRIRPDAAFFASQDAADIMQFFYDNGASAAQSLKVVSNRPDLLIPLVRFSNLFSGQFTEPYFYRSILGYYVGAKAIYSWLSTQPQYSTEELIGKMRSFKQGVQEGTSIGDPSNFVPEFLGWVLQTESFSIEMGIKALAKKEINADELEFAKGLGDAIKDRSRAMICGFLDYLNSKTGFFKDGVLEEENLRAISFFRDGIRAQNALVAFATSQGVEGLASVIGLPPYFFQEYRKVHTGTPEAKQVMRSILDLWEAVYLVKEADRGDNSSVDAIKAFWKKNEEQVAQGEQTGETETEIARDRSVVKRLKEDYALPHCVRTIDFGPWNGKRRYLPRLGILKEEGYEVVKVVGIDISNAPDKIPEMELHQMPFAKAGHEEGLIGDSDLASCDWSAANDPWHIREQILDFDSFSKCLREGGALILDTCFPEGKGSYDDFLREFKKHNPDFPEGVFEFKYASSESESKPFMLYYYEILIHLAENAGFEIMNLPEDRDERIAFFEKVISGAENIREDKGNAFAKPVWESQGRPRITLVAKKIKDPEESESFLDRLLFRREGLSVVENELQDAA